MTFDIVIVGAGPGGLACAEKAASLGLSTLVLERKETLGVKVCAGGITWNGLIRKVSDDLAERQFCKQYIYTRRQQVCLCADSPIIATVDRQRLGQWMADRARQAGAVIRENCQVTTLYHKSLSYLDKETRKDHRVSFRFLVGSDGSTSMVRRFLGLSTGAKGIGINYQVEGEYSDMEWHLDSEQFGSGYAWIFPHKKTVSIGAYCDHNILTAKALHSSLLNWGAQRGFHLSDSKASAEYINFDYQGYRFNNIFLVGDAAGLASALTGEGIYSAIISGESVAKSIFDPTFEAPELHRLIKNHSRHRKMAEFAGKNKFFGAILAELVTFCLRKRIIDFSVAEMAR